MTAVERLAAFACIVVAALLVTGCSSFTAEVSTDAGPTAVESPVEAAPADGVARCDPSVTHPAAPEEWYRDTPRYVGNEQPIESVRGWAVSRPGFQELWIDRDNNGWVTVAFDRDVDERQVEILERFPEAGVVAVLVDWNLAELRQLQDEIGRHLVDAGVNSFSIGASTQQGVVAISLGVLTDDRLAAVAPYADQPICVDGLDPDGAILDGPQLDAGDGWRLLAVHGPARNRRVEPTPGPPPTQRGVAMGPRVELATTSQQLDVMWAANASVFGDVPLPQVNFDQEVVVIVAGIESGSCPIRFDGIDFDPVQQRLTLRRVVPDTYSICTADANPIAHAVALRRSALPSGPFALAGPAVLWVDADLSTPGESVADDATLAVPPRGPSSAPLPAGFEPDPRPTAPRAPGVDSAEPTQRPSIFPLVVEPGFVSTYDLAVGCLASLGPINGYVWQVPDLPDDWLASADPAGRLQADLLLSTGDGADGDKPDGKGPQLQVTIAGVDRMYQIADGQAAAC